MRQCWGWLLLALILPMLFLGLAVDATHPPNTTNAARRKLMMSSQDPNHVFLDNGIVKLTFAHPGGDLIGIRYNGIENLLEINNPEDDRGYWDIIWSGSQLKLEGTEFRVITDSKDQVEISFVKTFKVNSGDWSTVPLNIDKRYIMRSEVSGFYTYAIMQRGEGFPAADIGIIRVVYKLHGENFNYMAVSDTRRRLMPTANDLKEGQVLSPPEARLLFNATAISNPIFLGEVDDKYQYTLEEKDNKVHGWICTDNGQEHSVGFWMITPSNEFRCGGPFKQSLTSHVGPTTMNVFASSHYVDDKNGMHFQEGETWKKVYGPVFVYLNSAPNNANNTDSTTTLWNNAKEQAFEEIRSWPYNFTQSQDFLSSDQRGLVFGNLRVHDWYINATTGFVPASWAYVGLAAPGEPGSWQKEMKGYQFWTQADQKGFFLIKDVTPGTYSLYATVPGVIGDYKYYEVDIIVKPGSRIKLSDLTYEPPRNGPTLWEIGIPDRSAAEFYIPEPYPDLMNKLYNNSYSDISDKFRQYGLWSRYSELYPHHDLIYTVGVSNYHDDWFYAHVIRNTTKATTWQIQFELVGNMTGLPEDYTLRLALASATVAELQIRFNDPNVWPPLFSTKLIGRDNAIARHGIHGLYWLFNVNIPSQLLHEGNNTLYLKQTRDGYTFRGVMYDYIRLEGPSPQ